MALKVDVAKRKDDTRGAFFLLSYCRYLLDCMDRLYLVCDMYILSLNPVLETLLKFI